MISFDPLIVSRGVFSLTLKQCLTDTNQGLSEAKQKTSHEHTYIHLAETFCAKLETETKPVKTEHVGFCSYCLLIPKSSNPQKFFVQLFIKHFKRKTGYRLLLKLYGLLVVLYMTTL